MTRDDAIRQIVEWVRASVEPVLIDRQSIESWPPEVIDTLVCNKLLADTQLATEIECRGCEERCFMEVDTVDSVKGGASRYFIVCNKPEKQSVMGKIVVQEDSIRQWKSSRKMLACTVSEILGFGRQVVLQTKSEAISLGMLPGKSGRRHVNFMKQRCAIEIYGEVVPVEDLLYFAGNTFAIDSDRIAGMLNQSGSRPEKKYFPNTDRIERRKIETAAMYENWRNAYADLSRKNPDKPKTWIAMKISKMEIAQGKSEETIRKNMSP